VVTKDYVIFEQDPEVIARVNDECSYRANPDWIRIGQLDLVKTQAVKTNQAFICPNPEIAVGTLCDGGDRSARPPSLSSPRVVDILRHVPGGIDRERRNSEADARECGKGTPEQAAPSKTVLTEGIQTSQPQPRLASA